MLSAANIETPSYLVLAAKGVLLRAALGEQLFFKNLVMCSTGIVEGPRRLGFGVRADQTSEDRR
jgi:hypothetical protein